MLYMLCVTGDAKEVSSPEWGDGEKEEIEGVDDAAANISEDKIEYLDLPPSWCEKLTLTHWAYIERYYQKEKTRFYSKAKVEKFSPYFQVDGLIRRITKFKDFGRSRVDCVEELFYNRRDKLVRRLRLPEKNLIEESFQRGRPSALKRLTEE